MTPREVRLWRAARLLGRSEHGARKFEGVLPLRPLVPSLSSSAFNSRSTVSASMPAFSDLCGSPLPCPSLPARSSEGLTVCRASLFRGVRASLSRASPAALAASAEVCGSSKATACAATCWAPSRCVVLLSALSLSSLSAAPASRRPASTKAYASASLLSFGAVSPLSSPSSLSRSSRLQSSAAALFASRSFMSFRGPGRDSAPAAAVSRQTPSQEEVARASLPSAESSSESSFLSFLPWRTGAYAASAAASPAAASTPSTLPSSPASESSSSPESVAEEGGEARQATLAEAGERLRASFLFVDPPNATGPLDGSYAAVLYERIKDHTDKWLSEGSAVNCATDWLLLSKDFLGLPWAAALPVIGCSLRLLTLPFAVAAERDIRLRGLHGAEFMELNKMLKEKQKTGLGSPEFMKERAKVRKFIEAHNLSVFPMSSVQMLFTGITVSLFSYALRNMAVRIDEFPAFISEHPGWFETLALPDPTLATTFLTIFGGLSILIAGWMVSDKLKKLSPAKATGPLSPAAARVLPSVLMLAYATFMGTSFPGGLVLLLLPAACLQAIFARVFRLRSVARALNFVPDSAQPLHAIHAGILRQRVPALVTEWEKIAAEKNLSPRKMAKGIVALWKEKCLDPKFQALLKKRKQLGERPGRDEGSGGRALTLLRPKYDFKGDRFSQRC
ncbi:hypothetical protein BESB_073580 [Besnoitia besnoiti]|uniref:60 kDa inner membrane protein n=1 Tax=Besnoitia besnoiti TaxID=94643 RepID=A0A2A9ME30_BESBE|nr:uncharacterized protein BESB_073580 [Besnoitia besnoiti]PFH34206.1 hypothetical protein BESB_073580 [Besnoitia besnoiti]